MEAVWLLVHTESARFGFLMKKIGIYVYHVVIESIRILRRLWKTITKKKNGDSNYIVGKFKMCIMIENKKGNILIRRILILG